MKMYFLSQSDEMTQAWKEAFNDVPDYDIEIVQSDFKSFIKAHPTIGFITVSSDSYGFLSEDYELQVKDYYNKYCIAETGREIHEWIPFAIEHDSIYIAPGSCQGYELLGSNHWLFVSPTNELPEPIEDYKVIYQCMLSTLGVWLCMINAVTEKKDNIPLEIVVPPFGYGCGQVPSEIVARNMRMAWDRFLSFKFEGLDLEMAEGINEDLRKASLKAL